MPRPKEFDREVVLEIAKAVFWRKGYEATSTEDLRLAMGIGRQSFYDSFGGKRPLYLEALRRYNSDSIEVLIARMESAPSPLAALEELLVSFSKEEPHRRSLGCMGVAAMCETGVNDPAVASIGRSSAARLELLLERTLRKAKARGEIRAGLKERVAARHLQATILGLKVMSKAGASPQMLRDVAVGAIEGLVASRSARPRKTPS